MGADTGSCLICKHPLPPRKRRYCSTSCAREASTLGKRAERAQQTAEFRQLRETLGVRRGEDIPGRIPHWLDAWSKKAKPGETARDAYNAAHRLYMRDYRRRRRSNDIPARGVDVSGRSSASEFESSL